MNILSKSESESEVAQSCPTLCDPVDCSPPGSSIHGILQARILEWVAVPFSSGSSWPRIEPRCLALQADSLPSAPPGKQSITLVGTKQSKGLLGESCAHGQPSPKSPRPCIPAPVLRATQPFSPPPRLAPGQCPGCGSSYGSFAQGPGIEGAESPWPPQFLSSLERRPPLLSRRLTWGGSLQLEPGARSQQQQQQQQGVS